MVTPTEGATRRMTWTGYDLKMEDRAFAFLRTVAEFSDSKVLQLESGGSRINVSQKIAHHFVDTI